MVPNFFRYKAMVYFLPFLFSQFFNDLPSVLDSGIRIGNNVILLMDADDIVRRPIIFIICKEIFNAFAEYFNI